MEDTIIDLIGPHTGRVEHIKSASGFGSSSTSLVEATGGRFFVKATPKDSRDLEAAEREATINPFIHSVSPSIRWQAEDRDWFVVGFDAVEGRSASFLPGSEDLPLVVGTLNRVSALPLPEVAHGWVETRWDRFVTEEERPLLRGGMLTHTDIHGRNFVIGEEQTWLVDWEWPTRSSPATMPTCLAVQLVSSGHTPEEAEAWVSGSDAWKAASPESLVVLAGANARMNERFAVLRPDQDWLKAMRDAAKAWHQHLQG